MNLKLFKCLLPVLLCLSSFQYARGQAAILVLLLGDKVATENFHFSLDAGLNFAYMPGLAGKMNLLPNFGLGIHMKINDHWYFAPEFKPLSMKGQRDINRIFVFPNGIEETITSSETQIRMNYLEMPLLMQYRFTNRIYFSAGPQFSFLLDGQHITEAALENGGTLGFEISVKNKLKTLDIGFPVEIGYALSTARNGKGIDMRLRYTPGFREVFSESVNASARNTAFQVILAFPFIEESKEPEN